MPTTQRRRHTSVIERLLAQPYRFELIQTMRMLDLWLRRNGVAHDETLSRYVRFQNSISMSFPPSQIESLSARGELPIDSDHALQTAFLDKQLKTIHITPAYMGFLGVNGVMPNRYTEDVVSQIQLKKHEGTRAFFDIFSNRIMALHYQAWAKFRVRHRLDARGDDVLLPIQLALGGVRPASARTAAADEVCDEVPAYYAAILRQRPVSARVIAGVLTEYFAVPVEVNQFVGKWDASELATHCLVGKQNATLGMGAMLGARCWERHSRVELRIGPLSMSQYEQFLPGTSGCKALITMLSFFATPALEFQMRLVLRADEVKPVCLGALTSARLGMGAFLVTKPERVECDELVYGLQA
jgi:type VI secretion system protein ImpH